MKPIEEKRARGYCKGHSRLFDNATQLAEAVCEELGLYTGEYTVPEAVLKLAMEFLPVKGE